LILTVRRLSANGELIGLARGAGEGPPLLAPESRLAEVLSRANGSGQASRMPSTDPENGVSENEVAEDDGAPDGFNLGTVDL
jgi:hypothetical protein